MGGVKVQPYPLFKSGARWGWARSGHNHSFRRLREKSLLLVRPHSLTKLRLDGFTLNLLLDLFIIWRQIYISFKSDENIGHLERRSKNICIIGGTLRPQRNTSLRTYWFNTFLEIKSATPDLTLWRLNWNETVQRINITHTWWWPKWGRNT
jgi:hypothetical protein